MIWWETGVAIYSIRPTGGGRTKIDYHQNYFLMQTCSRIHVVAYVCKPAATSVGEALSQDAQPYHGAAIRRPSSYKGWQTVGAHACAH